MTEKPEDKFRVEVRQIGEEDIPTRWQRFWGGAFAGNPWAWEACVYHASFFDSQLWLGYGLGYTRQDAIDGALADARARFARYKLADDSREVFYV